MAETFDKDDDDENWADYRQPSSGKSLAGNNNGNDDCGSEYAMPGYGDGTGKGKGTKDAKGKETVTEFGRG
jgi:hypothetical protein